MLRPAFLAVVTAALAGCGTTYLDSFTCADPDRTRVDANGNPDPCNKHDAGVSDAGDAGDAGPESMCPGQCVPRSPPGWSEPALLWSGPEAATAPTCPTWAPQGYAAGHAGLTVPPITCGSCACDPAVGSCGLPATITAKSQFLCTGVSTSFDPPTAWTGACTPVNAIPAGQLCGGSPCAYSIEIAPLTVIESGCAATVVNPPVAPAEWSITAGTCVGAIVGTCSSPGEICAPVLPPPPPGFAICIGTSGDRTCPAEFSEKRIFYDHFDDSRMCSACSCSTPIGGECSGKISIFNDSECSPPINTVTITSTAPSFCYSLPPGTALGSKSAGPLTHTPGVCDASGGEAMGTAVPVEPSTFCCRP